MKQYFQKLAQINPDDISRERQATNRKVYDSDNHFLRDGRMTDEVHVYGVSKCDKLFVMIELLFNEKLDLYEESWKEDYMNY